MFQLCFKESLDGSIEVWKNNSTIQRTSLKKRRCQESFGDAVDVVKDAAEQGLVLHGGLDLIVVDPQTQLRVFRLFGRSEAEEASALEERGHRDGLGQTCWRHAPLLAHLGVGLVELRHRHLLRLLPVVRHQQQARDQQFLEVENKFVEFVIQSKVEVKCN